MLALVAACSFQHGAVGQGSGLRDTGVADTPADVAKRDAPPDTTGSGGSGSGGGGSGSGSGSGSITCDPSSCMGAGGTCTMGVCVIPAGSSAACPSLNTCAIDCEMDNVSCRTAVSCATGTVCDLHCDADHSCDNNVNISCATGSVCNIYCKGNHSCDAATVQCASGAQCIYHCCGGLSCNPINCGAAGCSHGADVCP